MVAVYSSRGSLQYVFPASRIPCTELGGGGSETWILVFILTYQLQVERYHGVAVVLRNTSGKTNENYPPEGKPTWWRGGVRVSNESRWWDELPEEFNIVTDGAE